MKKSNWRACNDLRKVLTFEEKLGRIDGFNYCSLEKTTALKQSIKNTKKLKTLLRCVLFLKVLEIYQQVLFRKHMIKVLNHGI